MVSWKTLKTLGGINNSQCRSRPAAANSELARLENVAKFRGDPMENMLSIHCTVRITTKTEITGIATSTSQN